MQRGKKEVKGLVIGEEENYSKEFEDS